MARQVAEETEHKHLTKRSGTWYIKRMENGKVLVQTTGTGELKAARIVRDRILNPYNLRGEKERAEAVLSRVSSLDRQLAVIENEKPATSIMHGWQAYLDQHNRPDTGDSTLAVYEGQYEAFAKWFKDNHPERLDLDGKPIQWELRHVTQADADQYAGHLLKKVGASTFNRHVVLLSLVWRVLEKSARIAGNPWKQIGRKHFSVHSRRELTVEELGRVFNKAQGEMRILLALGTFCGLRLGDAACLEWGSVDLVKGFISLIPRKTARRTQKRVTLPIHRALLDMLSEIPAKSRRGFVMPSLAERYNSFDGALAKDVAGLFLEVDIKTRATALTKSEREAAKKAKADGVELPKPKATGKRASADCGFHSLRHTFVSLCAAGGVSQSVVQSLVGHGSPAMTAHYTHIGSATAQNAVAMIPDVTRILTGAEAADAAHAKFDGFLATLEGLTREQLEKLVVRAQELIGGAK